MVDLLPFAAFVPAALALNLYVLAFVPQFVGVFASGAGRRLVRSGGTLRWIPSGIFAAPAVRLAILERT